MRISDWSSDVCSSDLSRVPWSRVRHSALQARIITQCLRTVGALPRKRGGLECLASGIDVAKLLRLAAEVTIGCGLLIHRVDQVEHLDDAVWAQVEVLADQLFDLLVADLAGAEGGDRNRDRKSTRLNSSH